MRTSMLAINSSACNSWVTWKFGLLNFQQVQRLAAILAPALKSRRAEALEFGEPQFFWAIFDSPPAQISILLTSSPRPAPVFPT